MRAIFACEDSVNACRDDPRSIWVGHPKRYASDSAADASSELDTDSVLDDGGSGESWRHGPADTGSPGTGLGVCSQRCAAGVACTLRQKILVGGTDCGGTRYRTSITPAVWHTKAIPRSSLVYTLAHRILGDSGNYLWAYIAGTSSDGVATRGRAGDTTLRETL